MRWRGWPLALGLSALGAASCAPAAPSPAPVPAPSASLPSVASSPPPAVALVPAPPPIEPSAETPAPWPPELPLVRTAWCTEHTIALDAEACVVFPDKPSRTLLIYLHGLVPPGLSTPKLDNLEQAVANAVKRAGVVALIPLGKQGLAPSKLPKYWGWPTGDGGYRAHARSLVAKIEDKQRALEAVVGAPFEVRYLAGTSAGAYFVARLALHGDFAAQGFGAMSGGSNVLVSLEGAPPTPFYIGFGNHDPVAKTARELGERLRRAGWPVLMRGHDTGHGTREVYVDEALVYWQSERSEAPHSGTKASETELMQ